MPVAYAGITTLAGNVVLFGGLENTVTDPETWVWDGAAWSQPTIPFGGSPPSRSAPAMATVGSTAVLHGGFDDNAAARLDTWAWDGATWTNLVPYPTAPGGRASMTVVGSTVVMFNGDTWLMTLDATKRANGVVCAAAADCVSGFCVDGVCCNTACGGGAAGDCQACGTTAGAAANGTCGPVTNGQACSDGDPCTGGDSCQAGACRAGATPLCTDAGAADGGGSKDASATDGALDTGRDATGAIDGARDGGMDAGLDAADAGGPGSSSDGAADATGADAGAREAGIGGRDGGAGDAASAAAGGGCGCDLGSGGPLSFGALLALAAALARGARPPRQRVARSGRRRTRGEIRRPQP
jgi:hypothetical protein